MLILLTERKGFDMYVFMPCKYQCSVKELYRRGHMSCPQKVVGQCHLNEGQMIKTEKWAHVSSF